MSRRIVYPITTKPLFVEDWPGGPMDRETVEAAYLRLFGVSYPRRGAGDEYAVNYRDRHALLDLGDSTVLYTDKAIVWIGCDHRAIYPYPEDTGEIHEERTQ